MDISAQQAHKLMHDLVEERGSDGDICNEMWAGVKYGYLLASLVADVEEALELQLDGYGDLAARNTVEE